MAYRQQQQQPQQQPQQQYSQYDDHYYQHAGPYGAVDANASSYSVVNASGLDLSAGQRGGHQQDQQHFADMYDDGERSPLTAHAQPFAGYPPASNGGGGNNAGYNHHPDVNASQPSFMAKDPYGNASGHGGPATGYEIPQDYPLVPHPNSMMRPNYSMSSGSADSDVEWQRRARMPTRGKTTRIKLTTQGNFIHEYPVPGPIRNSVEAKWMAMCKRGSSHWSEQSKN